MKKATEKKIISSNTGTINIFYCNSLLEQDIGNRDPSRPYRVPITKGTTFRSQPGQELLAPLLIRMASVGLTRPSMPRSASIVPRKPPLGSGVSDSCWLSSSSLPPPLPPPGLELWTTDRYAAQKYRALLCNNIYQLTAPPPPGDFLRVAWSGTATV